MHDSRKSARPASHDQSAHSKAVSHLASRTQQPPRRNTQEVFVLPIRQAISAGIEQTTATDKHLEDSRKAMEYFLNYLAEMRPELRDWSQLTAGEVRQYATWLAGRGRKPTTVKAYLNPIRLGLRYVQENHPALYENLFIRRMVRIDRTPPERFLCVSQLMRAIQAARDTDNHAAHIALIMGGIAGLRLQEIADIASVAYNAQTQTLITGTKNSWSEREIPLLPEVAQWLELYLAFNHRWPYGTIDGLAKQIRAVLRACYDETKDGDYLRCSPHQAARTTFMNLAIEAGVQVEFLRAYCGHAPSSVGEQNYWAIRPTVRPDEMNHRKARVRQIMRERVLDLVARKLHEHKATF